MIVCDECRNVNARAFDCSIILEKEEDATRKTDRLQGTPKRMKRREVVRIPVALCEGCITKVCKSIGVMKVKSKLTRWNEDDNVRSGIAEDGDAD